jgi:hypothetical protein
MIFNRLQLVPKLGLPLEIVESFCLVQLVPQIPEPAPVFRLSLCVQHGDAVIGSNQDASTLGDCRSWN